MSLRCARPRRWSPTSLAPAASRSSSGLRLRLTRTVSGKPLVTRFLAMPWPMRPRPMKPMRGLSIASSSWKVEVQNQSTAVGSGGAISARRRSCHVSRNPLPAMSVMPANVSAVGQVAEDRPADERGEHELHVRERRERRGRRALEREDEQEMADGAQHADRQHQRDVEPRDVDLRRRTTARSTVMIATSDQRGIEQRHARILAAQHARRDLVERVAGRRRPARNSDAALEDIRAGLARSSACRARRRPRTPGAPAVKRSCRNSDGQHDDERGRQVVERGGVGERHVAQGGDEAQRRADQQARRARAASATAPCAPSAGPCDGASHTSIAITCAPQRAHTSSGTG